MLLTSSYFLMGELEAAFATGSAMRPPWCSCPSQEVGSQEFVESDPGSEILAFRPDFVLTINHLGVDKEGILTDAPGAAWNCPWPPGSWTIRTSFSTSTSNLASDWVTLFTWDVDNIESLKSPGILPRALPAPGHGSAPFRPTLHGATWRARRGLCRQFHALQGARAKLRTLRFSPRPSDLRDFKALGQDFMASGSPFCEAEFLEEERVPGTCWTAFNALPDVDTRLAFETLITWQATLLYRLQRVQRALCPSPPLHGRRSGVARNPAPNPGGPIIRELNYYTDLPLLLPGHAHQFQLHQPADEGGREPARLRRAGLRRIPADRPPAADGERFSSRAGRSSAIEEPGEIPELVRFYLRRRRGALPDGRRPPAPASWPNTPTTCALASLVATMRSDLRIAREKANSGYPDAAHGRSDSFLSPFFVAASGHFPGHPIWVMAEPDFCQNRCVRH